MTHSTDNTGAGWRSIESAPHACHVLASRFENDWGEWIYAVVMSPPVYPFTHWMPLPRTPAEEAALRMAPLNGSEGPGRTPNPVSTTPLHEVRDRVRAAMEIDHVVRSPEGPMAAIRTSDLRALLTLLEATQAENERLQNNGHQQALRARDAEATVSRLSKALEEARGALAEIMAGAARGDVGGDDVVWFSTIETLWEYCAAVLDPDGDKLLVEHCDKTAEAILARLATNEGGGQEELTASLAESATSLRCGPESPCKSEGDAA